MKSGQPICLARKVLQFQKRQSMPELLVIQVSVY